MFRKKTNMPTLLTAQHIASNICHEIANCISAMKLLEEDMVAEMKYERCSSALLMQLFDNLDKLTLTMEFFRNLYPASNSKNDILKTAYEICKRKKVKILPSLSDISQSIGKHSIEKTIAVILFILSKSNNKNLEVTISASNSSATIDIKGQSSEFHKYLTDILNKNTDEDTNLSNILVYYIKQLLKPDKIVIKTDSKIVDILRITICKP